MQLGSVSVFRIPKNKTFGWSKHGGRRREVKFRFASGRQRASPPKNPTSNIHRCFFVIGNVFETIIQESGVFLVLF